MKKEMDSLKNFSIIALVISVLCANCSTPSKKKSDQNDLKQKININFNDDYSLKKRIRPNLGPSLAMADSPAQAANHRLIADAISSSPTVSIEIINRSVTSIKNHERVQEINQTLAFYCMKHRKNSSFKNINDCNNHARNILIKCEKKHHLINAQMLACIKSAVKKII